MDEINKTDRIDKADIIRGWYDGYIYVESDLKLEACMLEMVNDNKVWDPDEVERAYKNCKYILTDYTDLQDIRGHLFCVSKSRDSFRDIAKINYELSQKGVKSILMGSYNNGGAIGVQYEVE